MKQIRFLPDGTTEIRDISQAEIDLWIQQQIEQEKQDQQDYEDWKMLAISKASASETETEKEKEEQPNQK